MDAVYNYTNQYSSTTLTTLRVFAIRCAMTEEERAELAAMRADIAQAMDIRSEGGTRSCHRPPHGGGTPRCRDGDHRETVGASHNPHQATGRQMTSMISEVYDALIDAGASEEKSRKAAEAIAAYETRSGWHRSETGADGCAPDADPVDAGATDRRRRQSRR